MAKKIKYPAQNRWNKKHRKLMNKASRKHRKKLERLAKLYLKEHGKENME